MLLRKNKKSKQKITARLSRNHNRNFRASTGCYFTQRTRRNAEKTIQIGDSALLSDLRAKRSSRNCSKLHVSSAKNQKRKRRASLVFRDDLLFDFFWPSCTESLLSFRPRRRANRAWQQPARHKANESLHQWPSDLRGCWLPRGGAQAHSAAATDESRCLPMLR
jgi:hypothetical protein